MYPGYEPRPDPDYGTQGPGYADPYIIVSQYSFIQHPVFVQVPVICIYYSASIGAVFKSEKDETAVTHHGISTVMCQHHVADMV